MLSFPPLADRYITLGQPHFVFVLKQVLIACNEVNVLLVSCFKELVLPHTFGQHFTQFPSSLITSNLVACHGTFNYIVQRILAHTGGTWATAPHKQSTQSAYLSVLMTSFYTFFMCTIVSVHLWSLQLLLYCNSAVKKVL